MLSDKPLLVNYSHHKSFDIYCCESCGSKYLAILLVDLFQNVAKTVQFFRQVVCCIQQTLAALSAHHHSAQLPG